MIAALCALFLVVSPAPLPVPSAVQQGELRPSELKSIIDANVRWIRQFQDLESGSYGSVEATIHVVQVLGVCPRQYRLSDGPFVRKAVVWLIAEQHEDGSFGAEGDDATRKRRLTLGAAAAFAPFQGEAVVRARSMARRFAGISGEADDAGDAGEEALVSAAELAKARAVKALGERNEHGHWGAGEGDLLATAKRLMELNAAYRLMNLTAKDSATATPPQLHALPPFERADRARSERSILRGASFLVGAADNGLWGFQGHPDPGITAMVAGALLSTSAPRTAALQKTIDGALDYLVSLQKEDGSIHAGQLANYVTSASILALTRGGRASDLPAVTRAREFLRNLQADEGEGYVEGDAYYGGVGYGGDERPDLSNLQMALEALAAAGAEPGDETFQKALVFLRRCQNRSESNDLVLERDGTVFASGNDGGSGYAPGDSKAGFIELSDGRRVPRSYGSMSYALLKGFLFAGLDHEDPRVQALWKWLQANYTLDVNPGFEASSDPTAAYQGLFYYFLTMAKALDLFGQEEIEDAAGRLHPWRSELSGRLTAMQRADGSWLNQNASRWYEGNPVLATAYAMVTLRTALPAEAQAGR